MLATFADKPNQTHSLLASVERLTGYVTDGEVTQLVAPDEQERLLVLSEYARRKPTPEPVGDETAAGEFWFYLSYAGSDLDENVERFYKDISAEVRSLLGLSQEIVGCLPRRWPSTNQDELDRIERALLNSRVLVPLYSPAYFASEQCARELNFFSLLSEEQTDKSDPVSKELQILPINWIPSDSLPPGVQGYEESSNGASEGLSYLMRLKRHEDDYQKFVILFARTLVKAGEIRAPKPITPRIPLRHAAASFANLKRKSVFISYGLGDKIAAHSIAESLTSAGFEILTRGSVPKGRSWLESIDNYIRSASCVLVLIGSGDMSVWQKREINLARQRQDEEDGQSFYIIPALLPGAEPASLTEFLPLRYWLDWRSGSVKVGELSDALAQYQKGQITPPSQLSDFVCPYLGLKAFDEEDARLFFGREALSHDIYERLKSVKLAVIIGPAGSGKSSLVRAGLLPMVRRQRPSESGWEVLVMQPGEDPVLHLASGLYTLFRYMRQDETPPETVMALNTAQVLREDLTRGHLSLDAVALTILEQSGSDRLLIVVDQFEEFFTLTTSDEVRQKFASLIFNLPYDSPVTVLLTIRSEFYDRLLTLNRQTVDLLADGLVALPRMSGDDLRRVIENPAWLVGLKFEPGLVERITDDFNGELFSLPLLEATLMNLWEKKEGDLLTHKAYQDLGGGRGAIVQIAESQLARMSEPEHHVALSVVTRMVNISTLTSQRINLSELSAAELKVVDQLAGARLVTIGKGSEDESWAELAFNALVMNWERLIRFITEDRDFILWRQTLRAKINDWKQTQKSSATLLTESDAKQAVFYLKRRGTDLNENERAYVEASLERLRRISRREIMRTAGTAAAAVVITSAIGYWQFLSMKSKRTISLTGRVVNADTEKPVSNARVVVGTESSTPVVFTDQDGIFFVKVPESTGPVRALVTAQSYESNTVSVPVPGSEIVAIRLQPIAEAQPRIEIITLPAYGEGGPESLTSIQGRVNADNPEDFRVVIYAYSNRWYIQPNTASPLIDIKSDGTWEAKIHQGTQYAVLLVPSTFTPEAVTDKSPEQLSDRIIDSRILRQ